MPNQQKSWFIIESGCAPVYKEPNFSSPMLTEALYGESCKIKSKYKYTLILVIFYYWFIAYLDIFEFFKYWKSFILLNNILLMTCLSILIFTNLRNKRI